MTRPPAVAAAQDFIRTRFPTCDAAFLGGSVVRGDATDRSDLDLVIITNHPEAPFRESLYFEGWPVELFAHTPDSLRRFFAKDADDRTPSLPMMCAEGVILRSADGLAEQIKAEAQALLDAGPPPLTPRQLAAYRYGLSDVLDDLEGSTVSEETLFIANQVAAQAADLALALNRRWSGHGKWTIRALRRYDPTLADQLATAVKAVYCQGDIAPLVRFADNVLASAGGRLFDGYKQSGKQ